ncbi:MAG TPA: DMT family transporter [Aggregatilineales bacterium]|nr:DMT family transporter [Aggregatilineales bacterium]
MPFIGELAAIGTSLAFSIGSVLFTFAGHAIGTGILNRVRLALALLFTLILHLVFVGSLYPVGTPPDTFFWMAASGAVGFVIGDAFLFEGFVLVGPRLSMLMMALAPVLSTIMAWLFLHEALSLIEIVGIVITMAGIATVVAAPQAKTNNEKAPKDRRIYVIGLLFAFGGALGQAGGSLLSKIGLAGGLPPISGNAIRLTAAVILVWVWAIARGQMVTTYQTVRHNPRAMVYVAIATLAGPVIGVWLALYSVQVAPLGIVTTLQSLPPIFLIPIGYFVFKERITWRVVLGTVVALVGSVLLFF